MARGSCGQGPPRRDYGSRARLTPASLRAAAAKRRADPTHAHDVAVDWAWYITYLAVVSRRCGYRPHSIIDTRAQSSAVARHHYRERRTAPFDFWRSHGKR